ncbi:helix-turn-helix domain-containing protein [Sphaerisporangium sp. B11E5]|uniref:helix-turn-helix domain-containing protein n=1 Tax=Sphaerisporangium sp. B11E5 TaxID=3153563 RepID=UPI00325F61E6
MTMILSGRASEPGARRLGDLIRRHRIRAGLTQQGLADLSTISVRAIRDLEQDRVRRPRADTIRLIADGLRLGPRSRRDLETAAGVGRFTGSPGTRLETSELSPPATLQTVWGRDAEVREICDELAEGGVRLLQLVGLSGVGKTRVALEVAAQLHREPQLPVLWHSSAGAAADYLATGDQAVTARLRSWVGRLYGQDASGSATGDLLEELLGGGPALLVIDGAPAASPSWKEFSRLLRNCPGLRLLITSEQPWGVPGERVFLVQPLELPCEPEPERYPALQIFLEHARHSRPGLGRRPEERAQAAEICRRLDGLPRALQSAASWLALHDLATLRDLVRTDSIPFLNHLADQDDPARYSRVLTERLRRLPAAQRELLNALCARPAGMFALEDVGRLTDQTPAESGRQVRDLLFAGMVRPVQRPSGPGFQVLSLIRLIHRSTALSG